MQMSKNTPMGQSWAKESSCFDGSLRWKIPTDFFLLQQHLLLVVLLLKVVRNTRTTNLRGHLINCLAYSFSTFCEHVVIIRLSTNWSVSDTCLQIWNIFKFHGNRLEIPISITAPRHLPHGLLHSYSYELLAAKRRHRLTLHACQTGGLKVEFGRPY